jgi:hypothetical protein
MQAIRWDGLDVLARIRRDSKAVGTSGDIDYARLDREDRADVDRGGRTVYG